MTVQTLPRPLAPRPPFAPQRDANGDIIYPETDYLPMAWTTTHYRWLTFLKQGLEQYFAARDDVFVAGDLLWYPVEGHPEISVAPDVYVMFGRPKGDRPSYKQWEEGGIAPQVVFEVFSGRAYAREFIGKLEFYERFGVQEYYIFDPKKAALKIWTVSSGALTPVEDTQGWRSPLLGVTFWTGQEEKLRVILPDGSRFLSYAEQAQAAGDAAQRADEAVERAERLAERLRAAGIDPDAI